MSRNEWEHGEIRLPSAEYAKVKKAVEAAARAHAQRLYDESQKFWRSLPAGAKSNAETYRKWIRAYVHGNKPGEYGYDASIITLYGIPRATRYDPWVGDRHSFVEDFENLLNKVVGWGTTRTPKRVQKPDCPFPTNRTTHYDCGEGSISFRQDRRCVIWDVEENNHARDGAREHPIAAALFKALAKVKWTRGSGGEIVGNDEYNQDATYAGGGANYVITTYGPPLTQRQVRQQHATLRRQWQG